MEVSLQFAKRAVNAPNAKFIYIAGGDFAFTTGEVIKDKFFLRPFFDWNATTTKLSKRFALGQQITESPLGL